MGIEGLHPSTGWKSYSKALKWQAIHAYLSGDYSLNEVIVTNGISSTSVLIKWIIKYNHGQNDGKAQAKEGSIQ
ncbi:transposase [Bacillus sp. JCM 19041]|uniref:transposase n=1 Tax=Bacillus sp. JCM 19041 TaxID=1460637 RepID=UPI0006D0730A